MYWNYLEFAYHDYELRYKLRFTILHQVSHDIASGKWKHLHKCLDSSDEFDVAKLSEISTAVAFTKWAHDSMNILMQEW